MNADRRGAGRKRQAVGERQPQQQPQQQLRRAQQEAEAETEAPPLVARKKPRRREPPGQSESEFLSVEAGMRGLRRRLAASREGEGATGETRTGEAQAARVNGDAEAKKAKATLKPPQRKAAARPRAAKKPSLAEARAQVQREQQARVASRVQQLRDSKAGRVAANPSTEAPGGAITSTSNSEAADNAPTKAADARPAPVSTSTIATGDTTQPATPLLVAPEVAAAPLPVVQPIETHEYIDDDVNEDLFFLQALEEAERKLVTPTKPLISPAPGLCELPAVEVEPPLAHTSQSQLLTPAPQTSPPILSPDDVMREFERLRRENEELRKSNERLQAVAAYRHQTVSSTSMANNEENHVFPETSSTTHYPSPHSTEEHHPTKRVLDLGTDEVIRSPVREKTVFSTIAEEDTHENIQPNADQAPAQQVDAAVEIKSPGDVAESHPIQQPVQSPSTPLHSYVEGTDTPMLDLSAVLTPTAPDIQKATSSENIEVHEHEVDDGRTSEFEGISGDNIALSQPTSADSDMSDDVHDEHEVADGRPVTIDCGNYNEYKQQYLEDFNEEEGDSIDKQKREAGISHVELDAAGDPSTMSPPLAEMDIVRIDSESDDDDAVTTVQSELQSNTEDGDESEDTKLLVSGQRGKRPVAIESSSSNSSESSSSESDDEAEANDCSIKNALEAALQAAAASSSSGEKKKFAPRAPPPRAAQNTIAPSSSLRKADAKSSVITSAPPQNISKKRARSDSTLGSSSTTSTKSKPGSNSGASIRSTLLWPALDNFYDFLLNLIPGQVGGGGQHDDWGLLSSSLRQFADTKLPTQYNSVDHYCTTQLDAITEELLASIGNMSSRGGGWASGQQYYLTSVSPCGSSQQSSRQKPTFTPSAQIFSESGFTGTSSSANDFILTFQPLRKQSNGGKRPNNAGSRSMELLSGDLIALRSPQWKSFELSAYGVVLSNSVMSDTSGSSAGDASDQVCVLLRVHSRGLATPSDDDVVLSDFSAVTELCMSNQRASKWSWSIQHVHNTTTSAREYQAIKSMAFFSPDLRKMLLNGMVASAEKAEPGSNEAIADDIMSPELKRNLERKYNSSQMRAIAACLGEHKTIMIQGPPGTGKTKTVLGLLSALLDGAGLSTLRKGTARIRVGASLQSGASSKGSVDTGPRNNSVRVLVAAPSNAAVDELVVRVVSEGLVDGSTGKPYRPRMVRVGRPESTNVGGTNLHIGSEREASAAKKTRSKMRKYAAEVENILLETQVARQKASFGTARAARQAIVGGAQIVFCTLSGAGSVALCDFAHDFDALIIDEAAQAVEASALIPFKFRPHRAILVGDHRQLPATVLSKRLVAIGYDRSLFQRMVENGSRVQMLTRQYRMHPDIARFPSSYFYGGKLVQDAQLVRSTTRPFHAHKLFRPFAFIDVANGAQSQVSGSTSLRNMSEVELVVVLIRALLREFPRLDWKKTIGVIAPYKQQIYELASRLAQLEQELDVRLGVEVNTVDGFQGREKDIIIYSCVRTSAGKEKKKKKKKRKDAADAFWADERRMNVAITRAKSSLWVLGNSQLLEQSAAWRALLTHARGREAYFSDAAAKQLLLP